MDKDENMPDANFDPDNMHKDDEKRPDMEAKICVCGCITFNLLRSGDFECSNCCGRYIWQNKNYVYIG